MDRMTKEAIRYLGYGRNAVDEQTLALIKDSFESLRSAVSPKSICRIFDLQHQSEDRFGDSPKAMEQAGIAYATDQIIDLLANGVKNIHIYSMNRPEVAAAIMHNISEIIQC